MIIKHKCSCGAEVEIKGTFLNDEMVALLSNEWLELHDHCRLIIIPDVEPQDFYKFVDNNGTKPV